MSGIIDQDSNLTVQEKLIEGFLWFYLLFLSQFEPKFLELVIKWNKKASCTWYCDKMAFKTKNPSCWTRGKTFMQ